MKPATLACLAVLSLIAPSAHAAPGESAPADPARSEQTLPPQKAAPAKPEPAKADPAAARPPQSRTEPRPEGVRTEKAGTAPVAVGREKRRRSYAACNRASHQRGYHGGKRRRFLIRCRLGYERPRNNPSQQQVPAAAPVPARKP